MAFAWPGSPDAILLREHETNLLVGATPEWSASGRSAPAAFVRRAKPVLRVVFARRPSVRHQQLKGRISATSTARIGIAGRAVTLRFNRAGLSQPVAVQLSRALPSRIGRLALSLAWSFDGARAGTSRHQILLTWRKPMGTLGWLGGPMTRKFDLETHGQPWVYSRIMEWSCDWATGRLGAKPVCDALLWNLPRSGLKYAIVVTGVRQVLQQGGGYCGAMASTFLALAGAQGIRLHKRAFHVQWRPMSEERAMWCAIVVVKPGLNRKEPAQPASTFHDSKRFPGPNTSVRTVTKRRYRFWGKPGGQLDGHSFTVLRDQGKCWLYDPSFLREPVGLNWKQLPKPSVRRTRRIASAGNFRKAYFDHAVEFMLGTMKCGNVLYRTRELGLAGEHETLNGLTVHARHVPHRSPGITFFWLV